MALTETILNQLGLVTADQLEARLSEAAGQVAKRAYEAGYYDGLYNGEDEPPWGDVRTFGYRRRTGRGLRDFSQLSHDQIINTVWTLYQSNGVAKRGLGLKRDHILGRGVKPATDDQALQLILDEFWGTNKFKRRLKKFLLDLSLFGELCLPAFVRQTDGRVRLGYLDPSIIEEIITHPHNVLERWAVVTKMVDGGKRIYRIIREDEGFVRQNRVVQPRYPGLLVTHEQATLEPWEEIFLKANGLSQYSGSCFYFDKNNVSNQPRGFSDLLQSADPLDQHDETLFSLGEREGLSAYFSWDVSLKGSKEEVQARASELRRAPPVKKGQINAHNESEIWTMHTADLKQPGTIATADALKTHALEGLGQPRHWHGEDNTANRATAESADNPTNKTLESEQDDVRDMIVEICTFARDQARIAGMWRPANDVGNAISVQMPEITKRDLTKVGAVLTQVIQAVTVAHLDLKILTRETVAAVIAKIISEFGVDYDHIAELEAMDDQAANDEMTTANAANQFLAQLIDSNGADSANLG
jgi:hypothetical protein